MKHKIAAYLFLAIFSLHGEMISAQDNSPEIARYEADVKKAPDDVEANMELIKAYFRAEKGNEALKVYQDRLSPNLANPANHYFVGYVYMCQDKYENALAELHKARELGLKSKWVSHSLGMVYYFKSDYEKAIQELTAFTKEDATDAQAYGVLASSEFSLKKFSESLQWAQKTLKLDPVNQIRSVAGFDLVFSSRPKEAVALLEEGISINPDYLKSETYINALSRAYIDTLLTGKNTINANGVIAAATKHPELLNNKTFSAIYAEARKVLPADTRLPRSIRGVALGQNIGDVDKIAKERRLSENIYSKDSPTRSDSSRLYDLQYTDPDYISLSVRLEGDRVVELAATYNQKMGSYDKIIELAKKSLGAPVESIQWKTDSQWPWHWRTVWLDDATAITISKMSETKDSTKSPEFTITERAKYESDLKRAKARQDDLESKRGKKMFGGD